MNDFKLIEKSIIKTYRKEIWAKFVKACKDYNLVCDNDKIMVCISGGKDSFLLAKLLEELARHGDRKIDLKLDKKLKIFKKDFYKKGNKNLSKRK